MQAYQIYKADPLHHGSGKPSNKILLDGIPTNIPAKLACQPGEFLAILTYDEVQFLATMANQNHDLDTIAKISERVAAEY